MNFFECEVGPQVFFIIIFLEMFKQIFKLYENVQMKIYRFCLLKVIFEKIGANVKLALFKSFFLNNFFTKSVQTKIKKEHSCANNAQSNHENKINYS